MLFQLIQQFLIKEVWSGSSSWSDPDQNPSAMPLTRSKQKKQLWCRGPKGTAQQSAPNNEHSVKAFIKKAALWLHLTPQTAHDVALHSICSVCCEASHLAFKNWMRIKVEQLRLSSRNSSELSFCTCGECDASETEAAFPLSRLCSELFQWIAGKRKGSQRRMVQHTSIRLTRGEDRAGRGSKALSTLSLPNSLP